VTKETVGSFLWQTSPNNCIFAKLATRLPKALRVPLFAPTHCFWETVSVGSPVGVMVLMMDVEGLTQPKQEDAFLGRLRFVKRAWFFCLEFFVSS